MSLLSTFLSLLGLRIDEARFVARYYPLSLLELVIHSCIFKTNAFVGYIHCISACFTEIWQILLHHQFYRFLNLHVALQTTFISWALQTFCWHYEFLHQIHFIYNTDGFWDSFSGVESVCTLSLPREIPFSQWPMKPVGYHLNKHRNMNNSNFRRFKHKSSLTSGHKNQWVTTLRVAQISSHTAVSHAVKKLNVNTVPLIQSHWCIEHTRENKQTTTNKKYKTFGRYYTKRGRAAVTEKGDNSSPLNRLSLPKN